MRFLLRNALGVYAVYGASIVAGLIVTPITLHALDDQVFGIWTFIGALTIYLAVLDFGLGPSVVRFTAEARGRRAPEETNAVASVALALYAGIGVVTLIAGAALAWLVPLLIDTPDDLVFETRLAAFLVALSTHGAVSARARLQPPRRPSAVRRPEPRELHPTVLYAVLVAVFLPRGGGLVLLGALTLGVTLVRFGVPLLWLRREFPSCRSAAPT